MPLMVNGIEIKVSTTEEGSAAAAAEIRKVTEATTQAGAASHDAGKEISGTSSEMEGMAFTARDLGIAVGIVTTGVTAMISVFKFGEIAAANERLRASGEDLAASYGGSLDSILSSVKETSLGTVSEMSIIEASNKAMMLGVSGSAEQLAQLMEIAALRGRAMGISTTQAFDDMVRGIGRMSPMILDNLGIVVDSEGTYGAYASSIGKAASELTRAEKIQALLNGVIEEGNKLLDDAGGLAYDNAAKYERFNAELENTKNFLLEDTIEMSRFADMGADLMTVFRDLAENGIGVSTESLNGWALVLGLAETRVERHNELIRDTDAARWEGLASLYATNTAMQDAASVTEDLTEVQSDYYESVLDGAESLYSVQSDFVEKQDELKAKQSEVLDEINMLLDQGWSPYSEKVQELQDKYDEFGVKIDEVAEKHRQRMGEMQYDLLLAQLSADGLTTAEYEIATAAGVAFGVFDQEAADASRYQLELTQAVATGQLTVEQYGDAIAEAMADGKITAQELKDILNSIPTQKTFTLEVIQTGSLAGTGAIGGGGLRYSEGTDGWQTVPPGYPNDSYPLWVESGERYAVIPASGSSKIDSPIPSGSFGGGGSAQIVFAPTIQNYFGNDNELMRQLYPAFVQMLDQAKADGHLPATF